MAKKKSKDIPTQSPTKQGRSYASAVTPDKSTPTPFLSLDPKNKSFFERMKKDKPSRKEPPPTEVNDNDSQTTFKDDKSVAHDPNVTAEREPQSQGQPIVNKLNKLMFEPNFGRLLEDLFEEVDLNDNKPHEILQGLSMHGIKTWNSFIRMGDDDVASMTKPSRHNPIPVSTHTIRMVGFLKQMIWDNMESGDPDAKKMSNYNKTDFDTYVDDQNLRKRNKVQYSVNHTGIPALTPTQSKSSGEKKYESWSRAIGKRSKTSFEQLHKDDNYLTWKPTFEAELAHQKLSHILDPKFDPSTLTCSYEKELHKEQLAYLWTVILHVLKNPLGQTCITKQMKNRDARLAYFEHCDLQDQSPARSFSTSIYLSRLSDSNIGSFNGSRVEFIANWFEQLRQLNEVSRDVLNYDMTKGLLLKALQGDSKLPDVFTELQESGDKTIDLDTMRTTLLHKGALYDEKDKYLKTGKSNSINSTEFLPSQDLSLLIHRANHESNGNRGPPNPEARLPDAIFNSLDPNDRSAWRQLPEETRIKFSRLMQSKQPPSTPDRRAYAHGFTPINGAQSQHSDLTDDASIVHSIRQIFATATGTGSHSSANSRPASILKSPTQSTKTPNSSSNNSKSHNPLLSDLDPAHPAVILADKKVDLYDKSGTHHGHINLNMHRWYTNEDDQLDSIPDNTGDTNTTYTYSVSKRQISKTVTLSLIDRGANGCVAGEDCIWNGSSYNPRTVNITGIDNHKVNDIPVGTVGAYAVSNRGPVILIFHEVAYTGRHRSILSSFQLEHHGNNVDDKNPAVGGTGTISTPDGYTFPLSFKSGLPYVHMRRYTQSEYDTLPRVFMTSDKEWDPTIFDQDIKISNDQRLHMLPHENYDVEGEYIGNEHIQFTPTTDTLHGNGVVNFTEYVAVDSKKEDHDASNNDSQNANDSIFTFWMNETEYSHSESIARCMKAAVFARYSNVTELMSFDTNIKADRDPRIHMPSKRDYQKLKPYFSWIPTKLIEATFKNSTQYGYMPTSPEGNLFKRWKAPNPAMNVFRLQDDLLTDKITCDTDAIDSGHSNAQIFFGRKSHIVHVEPISTKHPFIKALQNFVRKWGAPQRLLGDHAGNQASFKVMDYLRLLWIGFWCSEAYYKHQNMFERRYQTFKRIVNRTMDRTGTPPELWYLCMLYVAYVLNRVSDPTLDDRQPIFVATGQIGDISAILPFRWMEPVYYRVQDTPFPSKSAEAFGYWVGIAEHVGHAMTYRIWNKTTGKILDRSAVRTALAPDQQNLRAHPNVNHESLVHTRIAKQFGNDIHFGTILTYFPNNDNPLWHVMYDDGDNEDLNSSELTRSTELYAKHRSNDTDPHKLNRVRFSDMSPNPVTLTPSLPSPLQHHGEIGDPPHFIYSTNDDGTIKTTESAETAYLSEDALPTDYTMSKGTPSHNDTAIYVVLNDTDGRPKRDHDGHPILIKGLDHDNLQGITFLKREDDGTVRRARVIEPIEIRRQKNKDFTSFRIKYDKDDVEDIIAYNEIMNHIYHERNEDGGHLWKYRTILSHQGPLTPKHPDYKGSKYNLEIEWENGERSFESFRTLFEDDPVSLGIYAKKNNLLETEGWRCLKPIAKRQRKFERLIKQAKLRSYRTSPKYMYGFQVPNTYDEAIELDRKNGNTKWADATSLEMEQLDEYKTFIDMGSYSHSKIPKGFKRIKVHLVFAVKHDGRHKSRLVSRGDLTDIPTARVYAGVVSLRGLRMCIFIAELNGMEAYATDIGNAYLEAITQEKVCILAGPEFGPKEGHLLIIHKALYGLRSSGKEFGDLLAACLKELGFTPSKAEPEIFMRKRNNLYEYVATYVDDLCLVMKEPEEFLKKLRSPPYNFKLKGSGPMSFHLGCGFERDDLGVLTLNPRMYIEKMIQAYEQLYGCKPSTTYQSPLKENDHPELDTSEFLEDEETQQYQSLIGSLQWAISISRWDIQTAVMTMSSFRAQPRRGHLERLKRIYGYVAKFKHFGLKFRVDEPEMSHFNNKLSFDWSKSIYGDHREDIPIDAPPPLGNRVTFTHYFDANLMHDLLSGKAVTGCVHLANKTPIMWHSKKQATSETATYGAEFIAGRTCIEQIIDLRNTFRYLGVPINEVSYVF